MSEQLIGRTLLKGQPAPRSSTLDWGKVDPGGNCQVRQLCGEKESSPNKYSVDIEGGHPASRNGNLKGVNTVTS